MVFAGSDVNLERCDESECTVHTGKDNRGVKNTPTRLPTAPRLSYGQTLKNLLRKTKIAIAVLRPVRGSTCSNLNFPPMPRFSNGKHDCAIRPRK